MSHRKFEAPRHGSLGFLPRKRTAHHRGLIKSWPKDDHSKPPHLTAFIGYKAGMTHIVRDWDKVGSKMHRKEVVESVTILETPPIIVIGVKGYVETVKGLRPTGCIWAQHISEEGRRRWAKRWARAKSKIFINHMKGFSENKEDFERRERKIRKNSNVIRIVVHTQIKKIRIGQKKSHVMEIQINGGTINDKVDFGISLLEKPVSIDSVFAESENIDVIGPTKGKGFKGVVSRWGVKKLPRKTHKGLRKVACIGAWHPARVSWAVPRAGQKGYHQRTDVNRKVYRLGKALKNEAGKIVHNNASTEFDLTQKSITPLGGFHRFGNVNEDYIMLKGSVMGPPKRVIVLRKSLRIQTSRSALEQINLKFIDTSSKIGHGKFQTHEEKIKFLGPKKPRKVAPVREKK